jgi:uncharacterized protein YegP (UPF0339 family)
VSEVQRKDFNANCIVLTGAEPSHDLDTSGYKTSRYRADTTKNESYGEIIAASHGYETKANAEKGIEAVKTHAFGATVETLVS